MGGLSHREDIMALKDRKHEPRVKVHLDHSLPPWGGVELRINDDVRQVVVFEDVREVEHPFTDEAVAVYLGEAAFRHFAAHRLVEEMRHAPARAAMH